MKYFIIFHFHPTNSIQQNPSNNNFPIISHSLPHYKHSVPTMRAALHSLDEWGGWWSPEEVGRGDGAASEHRLLPSLPSLVPPAQGTPTMVIVNLPRCQAKRKQRPSVQDTSTLLKVKRTRRPLRTPPQPRPESADTPPDKRPRRGSSWRGSGPHSASARAQTECR